MTDKVIPISDLWDYYHFSKFKETRDLVENERKKQAISKIEDACFMLEDLKSNEAKRIIKVLDEAIQLLDTKVQTEK